MQQRRKKKSKTYSTSDICEALKRTNGSVYLAAESLGCEHTTIYRRLKESRKVRQVMRACRGKLLDVAETALQRAILDREGWAVCFFLKTQGKKRGYVENLKTEHSGAVGVVHSGQLELGVRIVQRDDFYRNAAHGGDAQAIEASATPAALAGEIQDSGMRPTLGQDGSSDDGGDRGARSRKK